MTQKTKGILITVAAVAVLGLGFAAMRAVQTRSMAQQLSQTVDQGKRHAATPEEIASLKRKFPARAEVSAYVERLYALADGLALENVEITTGADAARTAPRKGKNDSAAKRILPYPIKITFDGRYRAAAQFLKDMEGIDRYSRVLSLDMKPGKSTIKTSITIEIVTFEVGNAA
jgi:Tfp pilus assembly protein PilO